MTEEKIQEGPKTIEEAVVEVMNAYLQQELGNKVSQFSVQGLMQVLLLKIAGVKSLNEKDKKEE